ncbi:hypothetical protein [Segatella baroniae]|uniref:hypothetical protein n=1 Tax=Segatella baroniae TaxID=305719 RepID=UPI0012B518F1|nr:hypothetical protein [Segatella baroniae]
MVNDNIKGAASKKDAENKKWLESDFVGFQPFFFYIMPFCSCLPLPAGGGNGDDGDGCGADVFHRPLLSFKI